MLFLFQGCLGLSFFKNWTGWQDLKDREVGLSWGLFRQNGRIYKIVKIVILFIMEILYILSNFNKSSCSSCHFFVHNNLNQNYSGIF